jgi:hypothetical protein
VSPYVDPLRSALHTYLTADTTLMALVSAVHHQEAPQDAAPPPYALFERVAGIADWTFSGPAMADARWLFEGVCMGGDSGPAEAIAARLDTLLNGAPITVSDRRVLYLRQVSVVDYPRRDGADRYYHVGAIYRVVTQPN